jgi:hypothetical protein
VPLGDNKVHDSIRQLTARNGAEVPGQDDTEYLVNLVNDVRDAAPDGVESFTFNPVKPNSAQVELIVYGGDHSFPPSDADDTSSRAVEWIVDFFRRHLVEAPEEPNILFNHGWTVPVLMAPVLF